METATLDILVVDDEPGVRASIAQTLGEAGHRITEAEDGREALALILSRKFDVVILDIRLPKLDGLTVFRRLRLESPRTAAIVMTSYASIRDAVSVLQAGGRDFVTKPFDPLDFARRVIQPVATEIARRRMDSDSPPPSGP